MSRVDPVLSSVQHVTPFSENFLAKQQANYKPQQMFSVGFPDTSAMLQFAMQNYKPVPKKKLVRQVVPDNDKEQRSTTKINELNVNKLKELCKQRGLLCGGNKMQLLTRLMHHDLNPEDPSLPKKRKRVSAAEEKEAKKARLAKLGDGRSANGRLGSEMHQKMEFACSNQSPYDTDISESQWEADHVIWTAKFGANDNAGEVDSEEEDYHDCSAKVLKESRADLRKVIKGIKHLANLEDLLTTLDNSLYVLKDFVNWEDDEEPRTVETEMRLYSPIGNASSVQFKYDFHHRGRMSFVEYFVSLYGAVRSPVMLGKPQLDLRRTGTKLFNKNYNDSKRKFDRTIPSAICLKNYEDVLFGTTGKISTIKMLKIIGSAAGCDTHGESEFCDWVLKIAIRDKKMKKNKDGVSDVEDDVYDNDRETFSNNTDPPSQNSDDEDDLDGGMGRRFFGFPMF